MYLTIRKYTHIGKTYGTIIIGIKIIQSERLQQITQILKLLRSQDYEKYAHRL